MFVLKSNLPFAFGMISAAVEGVNDSLNCFACHGNLCYLQSQQKRNDSIKLGLMSVAFPGSNLGPSHLIWQFVNYVRVVYEFRDRIFHVHAKDMQIDREQLYQRGVLSLWMDWQVPRLPGLGEVNWAHFISALYAVGYDYVISIEHEDRAFEKTEDLVKRGFLLARDTLKPLIR